MAQYMITSIFSAAVGKEENADDVLQRSDAVGLELRSQVPSIKWNGSYALMDRYESIDFFETNSREEIEKVADIIRQHGKVQTVITPVVSWKQFKTSRKNRTAAV